MTLTRFQTLHKLHWPHSLQGEWLSSFRRWMKDLDFLLAHDVKRLISVEIANLVQIIANFRPPFWNTDQRYPWMIFSFDRVAIFRKGHKVPHSIHRSEVILKTSCLRVIYPKWIMRVKKPFQCYWFRSEPVGTDMKRFVLFETDSELKYFRVNKHLVRASRALFVTWPSLRLCVFSTMSTKLLMFLAIRMKNC